MAPVAGVIGIGEKIQYWYNELCDHPDPKFAKEILKQVHTGFKIGFKGPLKNVTTKNWPSALEEKERVTKYIMKHMASGSIEYMPDSECQFRLSPLGAFEKKNSTKIRVIHDLSWPPGDSINDGILKEDFSVKYTSISDAVALCARQPFWHFTWPCHQTL